MDSIQRRRWVRNMSDPEYPRASQTRQSSDRQLRDHWVRLTEQLVGGLRTGPDLNPLPEPSLVARQKRPCPGPVLLDSEISDVSIGQDSGTV